MEIKMSCEEPRDDEENPFVAGVDKSPEAVGDNSKQLPDVKGDPVSEQEIVVKGQEDEPRDDEDNPNVQYGSKPVGPSYDQTGQSRHENPDNNGRDDEAVDDKWCVSFLGPICWVIGGIVLLWALRLYLPLIQAFAESSGGWKVWYGLMCIAPLLLVAWAIVSATRIFISLPAGVDCKYSPDERTKIDLRAKLIGKYLKGFSENKSLIKFIGEDIGGKVESLCMGANRDIDEWFREYKEFQDALIHRAEKERDKYANAIALITITSSKSKLDVLGTLLFSTRMVLSIARIFNKRTSKLKAFKLTISWAANMFLSGQMQNVGAKAGGALGKGAEVVGVATGHPVVGKVAGKVVQKVTGMAIEGGVNKKLARLLGDSAIKAFVAVKGL